MFEKYITTALEQIIKKDFKFAFFQLCPPIDATAKKRYPNKGTGERIRNFLHDELNTIISLGTGLGPIFTEEGGIYLGEQSLEQRLYKLVRCGLVHDAEWPQDVVISKLGLNKMEFGHHDSVFTIPDNYIRMLPIVLIGAPENFNRDFGTKQSIQVGQTYIDLNEYWGNISGLQIKVSEAGNA